MLTRNLSLTVPLWFSVLACLLLELPTSRYAEAIAVQRFSRPRAILIASRWRHGEEGDGERYGKLGVEVQGRSVSLVF